MSRIYSERAEIDPAQVRDFFERRGRRAQPAAPLTAVLYQDQDPDLAVARDRAEKARVLPVLGLRPSTSVLDLGCGVGRWADDLLGVVADYCGIDPAESLLEIARARTGERPDATFLRIAAEELAPAQLPRDAYDLLIVAGVLIYMNDTQVERCLAAAARCAAPGALLYVREPTALGQRLTLREHWSQDLDSVYNALYRTRDELLELFERVLLPHGFHLETDDDLYPAALNNRAETVQRFYLLRKA